MALSHTDTDITQLKINKFATKADLEAAIQQGYIGTNELSFVGEVEQSDWNENNSSSPYYIKNKPTIPTVNDTTITITQGGVPKGTFTLNQSSSQTIALDAGGGSSIIVIDHIIFDNSVVYHPFYTYYDDETAYSLDDEQFYVYDNGSWTIDSSKTAVDGMVIFCNEDEAFYQYEVQHKLKSLSRGVPYRTLYESDPNFEERICLPTCDSVCTILITNNSRATTNYNIVILGQKGEEYHQQQTGHVHTINIINESSNNMTYTIAAEGYISYGNSYQHMYNGVDNNNSFVVKAGDAAEISIQLVPYDNGIYYGSIPNVIVKTDIKWTIQNI